jgi:hypothetical protein
MKNESQKNWVKEQLRINGFITRNEALRNFCSRLGAIIYVLKKEGYQFEVYYQKTEKGKDFVYMLTKRPSIEPERFNFNQ